MRFDGKEGHACNGCGDSEPSLRCIDCHSQPLFCNSCMINQHRRCPLHRIEVHVYLLSSSFVILMKLLKSWDADFWNRTTLRSIGLIVQLGHPPYENCASPGPLTHLVVVDTTGIHIVNAQFCACKYSVEDTHRRHQLFNAGWFPATHDRPKSAFTIAMLDLFHEMTLQGKISAHDFYQSLANLTDNAGLGELPVRDATNFL